MLWKKQSSELVFLAPFVDHSTEVEIEITVTDEFGETASDVVRITLNPAESN